jgi:hypothetical protein
MVMRVALSKNNFGARFQLLTRQESNCKNRDENHLINKLHELDFVVASVIQQK